MNTQVITPPLLTEMQQAGFMTKAYALANAYACASTREHTDAARLELLEEIGRMTIAIAAQAQQGTPADASAAFNDYRDNMRKTGEPSEFQFWCAGAKWGQAQQAKGVPEDCIAVPVQVLKAASDSLGSFVSDHGWGDADMQAMDNLDAYLAPPKVQAMLAAAPQAEPQPEREPLTDEQVHEMYLEMSEKITELDSPSEMFAEIVRDVEHALGIGTKGGPKP